MLSDQIEVVYDDGEPDNAGQAKYADRTGESAREPVAGRNISVDAYRGLVMLLMMAEVLQFSRVAESFQRACSGKFWVSIRLSANWTRKGWAT